MARRGAAAAMGLPAVQRRAAGVPGPAVRADGGGLRAGSHGAAVCEAGEQGRRGVGGVAGADAVFAERGQGWFGAGGGVEGLECGEDRG